MHPVNVPQYIADLQAVLRTLPVDDLGRAESVLLQARAHGRTIFIIGNGGSAATASHLANDLNKGVALPGQPRFRALALTDNVPLITAWANDTHYGNVFVEQMVNFFGPGDVLVAISGSGNSANVIAAVKWAASHGGATIGLTGGDGGQLRMLVDCAVVVPSSRMEQIEDLHLVISHAMCLSLRDRLAREAVPAAQGGR